MSSPFETVSPFPQAVKPRRSHIWVRDPHDHYVEPHWCSARLFEEEWFGPPSTLILDPACGWGRILKAAIGAGFAPFGSDIVDRLQRDEVGRSNFRICDFLKRSPLTSVPVIVSNPPYDEVQRFCERAVEVATSKVAMLVPLRRLPAARWLQHLPLETVYLLTPRPSIPTGAYIAAGNKPSGDTKDYCWLIFSKQMAAGSPRLCWLHRDGVPS
jgi:hypothetical protein